MARFLTIKNDFSLFVWGLGFVLLSSCGPKEGKGPGPAGPAGGIVLQSFQNSASQQNLPWRYLVGVAFLESGIRAESAQVAYPGGEGRLVGARLAESAFGLTQERLEPGRSLDEDPSDLTVQIKAYAAVLRQELDQRKLVLPSTPQSADDKFEWIWAMAELHREVNPRKDVAAIFARDFIQLLNTGFLWQSADGSEVIEFAAESPPLLLGELSYPNQQKMRLVSPLALLNDTAMSLPLLTTNSNEVTNKPSRVIVIHCPFNLSACLELQNYREDSDLLLQAHYVIPQNYYEDGVYRPIEITDPKAAVTLMNQEGKATLVRDAIVIMMVGQSGRFVDSIRRDANPLWLNDEQLVNLGRMVHSACKYMNGLGYADYGKCVDPDDPKHGPVFVQQAGEENYRWGEIPDYEAEIFREYLLNQSGPFSAVRFKFSQASQVFAVGDIAFQIEIPIETKHVNVQKLIRCANGRAVWKNVFSTEVRSQRQVSFTHGIFDSGANGNGSHFLRVKIYSQDRLLGWATEKIHVRNAETDSDYVGFENCRTI